MCIFEELHCPAKHYCFDCSCLCIYSFLINSSHLPFWESGKVMEAGILQTRNEVHGKASMPSSPTDSCSMSIVLKFSLLKNVRHLSGPMQFKPELLKGQLYCFSSDSRQYKTKSLRLPWSTDHPSGQFQLTLLLIHSWEFSNLFTASHCRIKWLALH